MSNERCSLNEMGVKDFWLAYISVAERMPSPVVSIYATDEKLPPRVQVLQVHFPAASLMARIDNTFDSSLLSDTSRSKLESSPKRCQL